MAKKDDDVQGLSIADLIEALKALKGDDDDTLKRRAQYEAEAHQRLTKRENEYHPAISVYSYPEGDRARPKPPLKCEMFWVGYPLDTDGLTPGEVEMLNHADAGEYKFTRTDGSPEKLTVKGDRDADRKYTRLEFLFPCRGDNGKNLPGMEVLLREAFGIKTKDQAELESLRAMVAELTAPAR